MRETKLSLLVRANAAGDACKRVGEREEDEEDEEDANDDAGAVDGRCAWRTANPAGFEVGTGGFSGAAAAEAVASNSTCAGTTDPKVGRTVGASAGAPKLNVSGTDGAVPKENVSAAESGLLSFGKKLLNA